MIVSKIVQSDRVVDATIIGRSAAIEEIRQIALRVAAGAAKVLVTGESGAGKDVVARFIHVHSARASRHFVPVNCAGLTETLLESELFGHVKGSFTGAFRDKVGKLELAHRGTIFLDEIGEMSLRMQALLLRFLEDGEIQPVGADHPATRSDARVIAATNRHLADLIASGQFREDLMYRLKVVHIQVPPLRDHAEDVRPLVECVIARAGRSLTLTADAWCALEAYRWPGNVRELQNVVEQLLWTIESGEVRVQDLPEAIRTRGDAHTRPARDRRRQLADELYEALIIGKQTFWRDVAPLFIERDITRADLRQLIRRGLSATVGSYRALLPLFGIPDADYKRFLNFLAAHRCNVAYREFRGRRSAPSARTKTA